MPTRLKRLELHGFKSFASPTTFVFDPGITAIIGPNGSGKSNIADALRWVLGEQSYANLRGRRTEDVIFAGSATRAPMGMAEVAVTLDNESGELPIAFGEVTITRRAFRGGENQYLINGSRVRLKDVAQLTASLGQAHTVIGQGLVDAVLSQRPEERRGLFEHAAGISGLRLKYVEAERHLSDSRANSVRLEDLLAEIEPRLRALERAARQAREYERVRDQLASALRRSYGWQWRDTSARLREARAEVERSHRCLETLEAEQAAGRRALEEAAAAVDARRAAVEMLRQEMSELQARRQRAGHELSLTRERRAGAGGRRADLAESRRALREALATGEQERARLERTIATLDAEIARVEAEVEALTAAEAEARARRAEIERRRREQAASIAAAERELVALQSHQALLASQAADLERERERARSAATERAGRVEDARAQLEAAEREGCEARGKLARLDEHRARLTSEIAAGEGALREATERLAALERQIVELSTRRETLERLRDSGAGLFAGVKAVLDGARSDQLSGVIGTLSSLLDVPPRLEAALEAALGAHLQDIVVERWADAEQAIAYLKRSGRGRATFQPLDTIRRPGPAPAPAGRVAGALGVAADLIEHDPRVEPVVRGLLGRVVVAEDLDATRALLASLPAGWSVVTVAGEIARASGTVTGGARVRESGTLARDRELRDLPGLIQRRRHELDRARQERDGLARAVESCRAERARVEQEAADAREALRAASSSHERAAGWLAELERAARSDEERDHEAARRLAELAATRAAIEEQIRAREARLARARAAAGALEAATTDERPEPARRLQEARVTLSELRERRRGQLGERERAAARRSELEREIAAADERVAALEREMAGLAERAGALEREIGQLDEQVAAVESRRAPAQERLDAAVSGERAARAWLAELDSRFREAQRELDRRTLAASRREDERDLLLERARRDLDVTDAASIEPILEGEPVGDGIDLPALERDIARLRERLRRIGMVGEDAIEQYERESARYAFLRQQLDDVQRASDALRALLGELDQTMAREFERTFGEVARAFETTFSALFGGGKARLLRAEAENGLSTGIDIVAQPPGKRLQSLALLSGGERALTAVALLFAILRVNPSPFCLLDEVDAALDESNVVRVRDELRALAARTQFVVVTHNRATIEGADTLYGITMSDDGLSRTLSLRLPAEAPA